MKKFGLFCFNVGLAVVLAALYAWALVERRADGWEAALRSTWWAGLVVGCSVGAGAALGPRPVLGWKKCLSTQVWIVITSAVFAFLLGLLPREVVDMEKALEAEAARRGLRLRSGIGAAVGTVWQTIQVYLSRRRAARRT